ncbi:hypothetical protein ARMSODRAFT_270431 [Armillaria solidipes]|uniref:Uncharacterized protein n=1 Tax=Armillaria solidipes TaxID=1076256 RepID=A0A2H3CPR1_9AGAR|nr:hypothetical protein ARMSODRAFT_270431 [Armillaria solidipes]
MHSNSGASKALSRPSPVDLCIRERTRLATSVVPNTIYHLNAVVSCRPLLRRTVFLRLFPVLDSTGTCYCSLPRHSSADHCREEMCAPETDAGPRQMGSTRTKATKATMGRGWTSTWGSSWLLHLWCCCLCCGWRLQTGQNGSCDSGSGEKMTLRRSRRSILQRRPEKWPNQQRLPLSTRRMRSTTQMQATSKAVDTDPVSML